MNHKDLHVDSIHRDLLQAFYEYVDARERWENSNYTTKEAFKNVTGALGRISNLAHKCRQEARQINGEQPKIKSAEARAAHMENMFRARQMAAVKRNSDSQTE